MALNEHDSSGAPAAAEPAGHSRENTVGQQTADIVRRAENALIAGDAGSFADALAEVATLDHRHRRHQARLRIVERGFAHRPGSPPMQVARLISASLTALVRWLEEDPAEPTMLAYAGVLAVEVGLYREAEALLLAAARLNPELPDIDRSIQIARGRRKAGASVPGLPADVRAVLPTLRPRMVAIAEAAQPATGLTLSLCMIVRDEEEMLPRCLEAIKDGVDEIVIVDTGSRDRTVEIAESYGARVLHHTWTGDFGSARNIGMDAATGDWLIIVDADEVFVGDDALRLHELKGHTWREAFYIEEINHTGEVDDGLAAKHNALRMIRNRPEYRYRGTVHEQLAHALPGYLPERLEHTDIRMEHFGYLGAVRVERGKSDRNMQLLLDQIEEGDDSAFVHFNLASEYAGLESEGLSMKHFRRAWELTVDDPNFGLYGFMPSLCTRYVRALRVEENWQTLDATCAIIHERFPDFTDIYFEQSVAAYEQGDAASERALLERCLELGDGPARYSATVGCGTFLAHMRLALLELRAGEAEAAEARMRLVRREHPTFLGLIDQFATLLLVRGATPDEVLHELTQSEGELSPSGWFIVAVNLQERGHLEQAEAAFRGALERRGTLDAARVGLADALLVQGRVREAAEQAEMVPFDKRVGGPALRTALFARLALDEGEGLDEQRVALAAELPVTDLDDAEQDVLRGWVARRTGHGDVPALTRGSIDKMTPLLDGLLRLGAADAFADMLSMLPDTGIDRRTQHEVVATLFLRRGLPELAGDEWIAAVNETGPDAAAYAGLAEVARMQGLLDDARTLAAEALALEPEQPLATRVLQATAA